MGFCFLTNLHQPTSGFSEESFYAFAALRGTPALCPNQFISLNEFFYQKIDLLHPWDVLPYIYGPSDSVIPFDFADAPNFDCSFLHGGHYVRNKAVRQLRSLGLDNRSIQGLRDGYDPVRLWRRCAYDFNLTAKATDMCASWLNSSSKIQTHIYNNPNPLPAFQSPPIHWEHCVMEGHPLFPISRTVRAIPPLPEMTPSDFMKLFGNARVRLAAIPRTHVELNGDFEQATRILVDRILNMNGNAQEMREEFADHVLVPIHQCQVPNIEEKLPNVHIFPEENHVIAYGLSSGRTVAVPGIVDGQTIKLSLGIELASITRNIPPASARYGYRFSTEVVPHMSYNPNVLTIQTEPASVCYLDSDPEIAKHLCCIVRNSEEIRTTATNHRFAVCAALVEKIQRPDTSQTLATHAWKLDTQEKRTKFLNEYIRLFFNAIIPPCRDNGIAFECHAQNTILRFDPDDHGAPRGFLIRDLCDMQVHPETLVRTIGRDVRDLFPEGGYNCAKSLEQVYIFLYYGAIYIHLQTLIRVLGLHDNGIGWALAREHFAALVNRDHPMYDFFLRRERVPIRSYTRTRLLNTCVNSAVS
ncbi:hypothetical protein BJV82DRAFT_513754 [Fennellomyces sp. T-0311]|nr:hypothetical protein BJV82DRAFT_513754 [Fennellomyces sp. T-0311]